VRLLLRQGVKETPNALGFSPTQLAESRRALGLATAVVII
jgi:hypothetical protein